MKSICGLAIFFACQAMTAPANANELIPPGLIQGDEITTPLSDVPATPEAGRSVFEDREQGHCVLCHAVEDLDAEFQGNVGPDLSNVGDRLSPAQIRFRIVDLQSIRPDTVMPSYYRLHDLNQVGAEYRGQTILSADQIEHLVTFLSAQRQD